MAEMMGSLRRSLSFKLRLTLFALPVGALLIGSLLPDLSPPGRLGPPAHFLAYAGLTVLAGVLFGRVFLPAILVVIFSGFVEFLQTLVPGRHGSWLDFMANAAGAVTAVVALLLLERLARAVRDGRERSFAEAATVACANGTSPGAKTSGPTRRR